MSMNQQTNTTALTKEPKRSDYVTPADALAAYLKSVAGKKFFTVLLWGAALLLACIGMAYASYGVLTRFIAEPIALLVAFALHLSVALSYHFILSGERRGKPFSYGFLGISILLILLLAVTRGFVLIEEDQGIGKAIAIAFALFLAEILVPTLCGHAYSLCLDTSAEARGDSRWGSTVAKNVRSDMHHPLDAWNRSYNALQSEAEQIKDDMPLALDHEAEDLKQALVRVNRRKGHLHEWCPVALPLEYPTRSYGENTTRNQSDNNYASANGVAPGNRVYVHADPV